MDELSYDYYDTEGKPNQLKRVDDAITQQTNANDIKDQVTKNNYLYNSIGQLIENKDEKITYEYNASGLVTKVFYNNQLKVHFFYNDKGFRTIKKSYKGNGTLDTTTHYVRDASGSTLAIYENKTLQEIPIYGASRLGIYKKPSNTSVYQLTDHLGNVRAVIAKQGTNAVALVGATDYYPFGMPMPNRQIVNGQPYRYAYQGQEKDPETGKEAFQLRLWDGRIGRWLTTDPAGQYSSPYLGMGNNPVSRVDPDGGEDNPVYGANGEGLLGTTESGMQGEAIIMDAKNFTQGMSDAVAMKKGLTVSALNGLAADLGISLNQSKINSVLMMGNKLTGYDNLKNRPDWDGTPTRADIKKWRNIGKGNPLFYDYSKMNFKSSALSVNDFKKGVSELSVNFYELFNIHSDNKKVLYRPSSDDYLGGMYGVGTVKVVLLDPKKGTIMLKLIIHGKYFDINDYKFPRTLFVSGDDFPIGGYGTGSIHIGN